MELELGLALPNPISHNSISYKLKGFDLNNNLPTTIDPKEATSAISRDFFHKRDFDKAFSNTTQALPLLWDDHPDDDGDESETHKTQSFNSLKKNPSVIGWPPIKSSWRKLQCYRGTGRDDSSAGVIGQGDSSSSSSSLYVKVKMEGVAIGRKVDLNLYTSYDTLTETLEYMFGKYRKNLKSFKAGGFEDGEEESEYKLTYEDQEGDWMLVGDVPWETFVKLVKRLKIQRGSN